MTRLLSVLAAEYHFSHADILALPFVVAIRYLYCVKEKYQTADEGGGGRNADIISGLGSDYTDNCIDGFID